MNQKIRSKTVFIIMTVMIIIFSAFMLIKIISSNELIYNECEPRYYTEWTKEVEVPLTPEKVEYLEKGLLGKQTYVMNCKFAYGREREFCEIGKEEILEQIEVFTIILERGYDMKSVADEERRAKSREEVENYENCLENQELAIKKQPEQHKFLFIGDILILIVGTLTIFTLKEKKNSE